MSCDYRVSPLFKQIQRRALELVRIYETAGFIPRLLRDQGPCADCGKTAWGTFHYEHRDYNDALNVRRVCAPCNKLSKKAVSIGINPDTLETWSA